MVFQKKGGAATKRSFTQANEKVPKKVFQAEEEEDDDDDLEEDSDLDTSDSDASDSGNAITKLNARGKQTSIQGKGLAFIKTTPKGQIQSPGLFAGKMTQHTGPPQKLSMQAKKEFPGKKNQGKVAEKEALQVDESEDDDDDDDDLDDEDDSDSADGKMNVKGKQTPQGKGSSLMKTPKGQAQTPMPSSGKKNQVATPSPKQAKQNNMKEFPGMKGSAKKKTLIKQQEKDDDDDDDDDDDEEEDDDDDDDDDSDDEKALNKSLALNKSAVKKEPNGKKDMHVSFDLSQKGGSAVKAKSQNTPVQGKKNQQPATPGPQQGKPAKGKPVPKGKKEPESDEDEDDLSDEEDEDMEDDDVDDEEDEDDDDDDEEDDQEAIKKKIASLKKEVLPKKEKKAQNESPEPKSKKGKTLLKNQQSTDSKAESRLNKPAENKAFRESLETDLQRKRERDARNLFVRGLPGDITVDEIKALSPDIIDISLPKSKFQKKKGAKSLFGFLEFANEKKAEENYVKLQKKKLRGQDLYIDYSGEKSKHRAASGSASSEKNINRKKLFVSALPVDVTMAEVAQLFPRSISISLNNAPEYRNCSVLFLNEEDAADAFKANEKPKIRGRSITVLYAIENPGKKFKKPFKRPFEGKRNTPSNKRMKL